MPAGWLIGNIVVGVIGGYIFSLLHIQTSNELLGAILTAEVGAVILL